MYERWPLIFAFFISASYCYTLSIDETLRPKDSYFVVNRIEESGIKETVDQHVIKKRSADPPNITVNPTDLKDNHQQLLVHWPGNDSNVFICLARNIDPIVPTKKPTPSAVYVSYDYGVNFKNLTDSFTLDSNGSYASVEKFSNHPRYQHYMVFLDKFNQMFFVTKNYGRQITKVKPPFQPMEILFYPEDPFIFLAYDVNKTLWITRDFGGSFSVVQEFVKSYSWAERWTGTWADTPTRSLLVQRIEPSGNTTLLALGDLVTSNQPSLTVKMHNIEQFTLNGDFIFVTRRLSPTDNDLYISYRGGDFYQAIFDSGLEKGNFHVTDVSDVRVMVAVAHSETLCNLYISEVVSGSNYTFRISLERLFCFFPHKMWTESWLSDVAEETFADLHKVQGIRGVYLASQVTPLAKSDNINPEYLRTLITFDWGAEWRTIIPPTVDETGRPFPNCSPSNCTLHLTQKFMYLYPFTRTVPILSSASAPGLIVATGVLGSSLKGHPGVFVSRDAGLTWKKVLRENYIYNFGDHGGIMAAVKYFKSTGETEELLYSTDEGEKWSSLKFVNETIRVYNLMTEPGENTTWFTVFGSKIDKHGWMIINVDLKNAFSYNCTKEDYKMWIPSSGSKSRQIKMSCVMGLEETFERRIIHSNCFNGKNYDRPILKQPCTCDIEDFECDFGFLRHVNSAGCIRNKSSTYDPYKVPDTCKPGAFYNRTKGYRKIDGDACVNGFDWQYLPEQIPCPFNETSNFLILALKKQILRFNLADTKPKPEELPVQNLENVIAIDFDMKNNCLFYGDLQKDVIVRQCLSGKNSPEVLVKSGLKSVEGIAYDWISHLLYFVDSGLVKIEAVRTDIDFSNRMRKTVLNNTVLDKPRGITLHPMAGYLFWTDWSREKPLVGRANLDGSEVKQLFTAPQVFWPNGITVDHIAEQIYWVDAKLDYIAAADLHGRNFRKIVAKVKQLSHPFSVAVFKDLMYWDDWEQKRIFVADKDHGVGIQIVSEELDGVMDLKIYAHSVQEGTNACTNSSSVCSHLCFAQPENRPPVCECPDNMTIIAGECMCLDGTKPFANHTCPKSNKNCSADQFTCANNYSCVPMSWKCNGINECGDNSDEADCTTNCDKKHMQCRSGRCIPLYWVCDTELDCPDGDDEWNCTKEDCTKDQFQCKNGQCISQRWHCDGEHDCKDGSDEEGCPVAPASKNCTDKEFRCPDVAQTCIPKSWVCDGEPDCPLNKDEENCPNKKCDDESQFQCAITKRCIYKSWVCDNETDCGQGDNSDEEHCPIPTATTTTTIKPPTGFEKCKDFMFKCTNGKCIPDWWVCDGVPDCGDETDEIDCAAKNSTSSSTARPEGPFPHNCKPNEFQCKKGDCIPSSWTCDGRVDCEDDDSDEAHCDSAQSCPKNYIKCRVANTCYLASKACDGHYDCPDHSDEMDCANKASSDTVHEPGCPVGYFKCDGSSCIPLFKFCDGHKDCYDDTDETDCKPSSRVYQVTKFSAIEKHKTSTTLPIRWYILSIPGLKFEFLPSIAVVTQHGQHQEWSNGTWTPTFEYTFEKLSPYTEYNLTVYVRIGGQEKVFPPAFYFTAITKEDLPSPPWNISAIQKTAYTVDVSWKIPHQPNGIIREYIIYSSPPLPPIGTIVPSKNLSAIVSTFFAPGRQYSFWVVARNGAGTSNSSEIVKVKSQPEANLNPIQNFTVQCTADKVTTCELKWQEVKGAKGYRIVASAGLPYPELPQVITNDTTYKFPVLAPGVDYKFRISALHKNYEGPAIEKEARTEGDRLPFVDNNNAFVNGTSIRLTWKQASEGNRKVKWVYGIYYGLTFKEMIQGPKLTTENLMENIEGLESCEYYLFDVGVVGPLGIGPLSHDPVRVLTNYSKTAPPKALTLYTDSQNETMMVISWTSSCNIINEPISYVINIEELVLGKNASIRFKPANSTKFQHRIVVQYGARYRVTVQTGERDSIRTKAAEHWAPLLPVPNQVKVEPYNSSYKMHWQLDTNLKKMPKYDFEVMVCEGDEFDENKASSIRVKAPPFYFHEMKVATTYTVAVRLVSEQGFLSSISEVNMIQIPLGSSMVVVSEAGLLSVIIPVALVIIVLVAVLVLYMMKHYRLRNTFTTFANSHYSTSSGAAIFTDRLDDEDSPVIRGFSDDEPLVVA